jgi:methyl-galactoside transport system substrate-binding protein
MKFKFRFTAALLAGTVLIGSVCCACTPAGNQQQVKTIHIGVSLYRRDDTFITSMCEYLEAAAKKAEQKTGRKIVLNILDSQSNQSQQDDQVDTFLSQNYDAICVNMVDRTSAGTIADKARKANVPLIFFNREPVEQDLQSWVKAFYVGADAAQSGTLQGQLIVNAYRKSPRSIDRNGDGKIQYVVLEGEQGHQDSLLRTEYSIKAVEEAGIRTDKLASSSANWQRAQASVKMKQWIQQFGSRIETVFCNNDDMALGAIDALYDSKVAKKNWPAVVGVDGTPSGLDAIRSGTMLGSVYNNAQKQAEAVLALSLNSEKVPSGFQLQRGHYIYVPYKSITKENSKEYDSIS